MAWTSKHGWSRTVGRYIYYARVNQRRTGDTSCPAKNISQEKLEAAVYEALVERVLVPERIDALVSECVTRMRTQSEAGLKRLYDGIASGVLDPTEPILKEQLDGLKLRKAEASADLERCKVLQQAAIVAPTPTKIERFVEGLRLRLTEGNIPLRKDYIRAFVDQITVKNGQIMIKGRKNVLATAAARGSITPSGAVPGFVPEWRARQESNL